MLYSKSFGYALRGILYVALKHNKQQTTQADEIARELVVPKHFLSKIMKKLVKHGILLSVRGPHGGFYMSEKTMTTSLFDLVILTGGHAQWDNCVLRLKKCNASHPCPLHHKMQACKREMHELFTRTTIKDLLDPGKPDFIKSISTV